MLDRRGTPLQVGYSQHCGGVRRLWRQAPKVGARPVAYVALGSHANYPARGTFRHDLRCWPAAARVVFDALRTTPVDVTGGGADRHGRASSASRPRRRGSPTPAPGARPAGSTRATPTSPTASGRRARPSTRAGATRCERSPAGRSGAERAHSLRGEAEPAHAELEIVHVRAFVRRVDEECRHLGVHRPHREEAVRDRAERVPHPVAVGEAGASDRCDDRARLLLGDEGRDRVPQRRLASASPCRRSPRSARTRSRPPRSPPAAPRARPRASAPAGGASRRRARRAPG